MDALITPEIIIQHYLSQQDFSTEDIGIAPTVVVSWAPKVIKIMAESIGAQPSKKWMYQNRYLLYTGEIKGQPVTLTQLPVGAPGTVMVMEELIAFGARTFLGLGWAGSLQPSVRIGSGIIPTSCLSEEGTSKHYIDDEDVMVADAGLVSALESAAHAEGLEVYTGSQWTTDAPYRELKSKVRTYREKGILGVDMETSAMYALGVFRKVHVCNLLVVSDELGDAYLPHFGTTALREASLTAMDVILRAIREGNINL
jgi:uridine phosphorylase